MGLLSGLLGIGGTILGGPVGGMIGSTIGGAIEGEEAASEAAAIQSGAAEAGIAEQRRQFDEIQKLLAPYVKSGTEAIGGFAPYQQAGATAFEQQQALAGILGPEAQQAAINQIEASPFLQSQIQQGEEALLQRASATGGLRGGNIQAALAQFRPQMLQQAVEQQYARLGGLAGTGLGATEALYRGGQASAVQQASQAGALGANVSGLLQQQGAARAGGALGSTQLSSAIPGIFGAIQGAGGLGKIFGGVGGGLNIGTALNYGTNVGSQQTSMLAAQEAGMF